MLRHYLTTYLIVTGIGGFIAITCPILVILGSIAIFPGLALALMPTAFLWGLFFAVIWQAAIRFVGEWPAAAVAFSLTMALLTYLPKVLNAPTARQAAEARTGDLLPESRIELKGIIEVQTESYGMEQGETAVGRAYGEAWPTSVKKGAAQWDDAPLICDERCMHLVFKPGVEGVIVRPMRVKNKILLPVTLFRISPAARDESLASPIGSGPLQAAWKLRISQGERVERTKPGERKPDFILSFATQGFHDRGKWSDWSFGPTPLQTERVTISTGDGRVLLRQTSGTTRLLSAPLNVWPQISMENASFGWARGGSLPERVANKFNQDQLLAKYSDWTPSANPNTAASLADADRKSGVLADAARQQLGILLRDPARTAADPGFELMEELCTDISGKGWRKGDVALLAELIADPRVRKFGRLAGAIYKVDRTETEPLRLAISRRILNSEPPGEPELKLGQALRYLPLGVFVRLLPEERRLLGDANRRLYADGLLSGQSDRGAEAVPELLAILRDLMRLKKEKQKQSKVEPNLAIVAVLDAFAIMGPQAGPAALPGLEAIATSGLADDNFLSWHPWLRTLARLGKPIESFRKPGNFRGSESDFQKEVRYALKSYENSTFLWPDASKQRTRQ